MKNANSRIVFRSRPSTRANRRARALVAPHRDYRGVFIPTPHPPPGHYCFERSCARAVRRKILSSALLLRVVSPPSARRGVVSSTGIMIIFANVCARVSGNPTRSALLKNKIKHDERIARNGVYVRCTPWVRMVRDEWMGVGEEEGKHLDGY